MDELVRDIRINGGMVPRDYQRPYMDAMDAGCKFAVWVMHRRGGKDRTALAQACKDAFKRVGLYWHCLPTLAQGRKAVWDNITNEGTRLIDATFPPELVKRRIEDEMKFELINGSMIQVMGADNVNSNMGANPVHVTFSEWALTDPRSYDFIRPILRENRGSASFIYTPRGYNHGWKTLQIAKKIPGAFCAVMGIDSTGVLDEADMALERELGMPEELIQQEYYCDFSVANVGSIVGRLIAAAEREGRIDEGVLWTLASPVVVSCDLGFRDAAAFWFWQLRRGGFDLIHYDEASGLDAEEWVARLKASGYDISTVYLPHDARAKTMATRFSVIETFAQHFHCEIVPRTKISDRINAARMVLPRCRFHSVECARGLDALRAWEFKFDEERKTLSAEPLHNWASHGADAYTYGAQVVRELFAPERRPPATEPAGASYVFTLEDLFAARGSRSSRL
jgi:phage terminase large subunit